MRSLPFLLLTLTFIAQSVMNSSFSQGQTTRPHRNADTMRAEDTAHSTRLKEYFSRTFPHQIASISADALSLEIEGKLGPHTASLWLGEVPIWGDATQSPAYLTLAPITEKPAGHFAARLPRFDGPHDRLLSAWVILPSDGSTESPLSALHYVDHVKPRADLPPAHPASIKGLAGCPFDHKDITDLGISSATLNIVLNTLFFEKPALGRSSFPHAGKTWYVADKTLAHFDQQLSAAAAHHVMVSAIILIAPAKGAPPGEWARDAAHPDADPTGIFVMPNFTTRNGVEAYAAAMDFLAERYSRPDGKFGRIHHWIMHNEVNSGFHWTTAGQKSLLTYLDLYQKSLRLTWLLARQYDPNARPLISLDHWWNTNGDRRGYPARAMLEQLQRFTQKEGDFDWGIAFHPYAQDLMNPRTWEDPAVTFRFDTPFITFKNIEVLDAFVRQPTMMFRGTEPREIQLTEQGLNSRDYSDKSLTEQAAGLAYAWNKIRPLKTITAFQYHAWSDHRSEGGLRIGIRKFPDHKEDPLGKKPAWDIFKALGTNDEAAATDSAKKIVGVKEWNDVQFHGQIR